MQTTHLLANSQYDVGNKLCLFQIAYTYISVADKTHPKGPKASRCTDKVRKTGVGGDPLFLEEKKD